MFSNYLYLSGMSKTMDAHFKQTAQLLTKRFRPQFVIDIGGNDGSFLKHLKVKTLNIDPAQNLKALARKNGVINFVDYFNVNSAKKVVKKYGQADIITGTNVFAHIDDLKSAIEGVDILLKPSGVLVMEFPYLWELVKNNEFDTIYHEHLSYFLIRPLAYLLAKQGFEIFDIERFSVHGGSIRVYAQRIPEKYPVSPVVEDYFKKEVQARMYDDATYVKFAKRIKKIPASLIKEVKRLKRKGKRVVGYGASAKGNVLLNMCGLGSKDLDYIVDSTPYKQGLYTPGTHIPIISEADFHKDNPDYAILFIWNLKEEVFKKEKNFKGQFIIPVPKLHYQGAE
jgi:SAM-dependent methyltransferase